MWCLLSTTTKNAFTNLKSVNPAFQNSIIAYCEVKRSTTFIINNCFCWCYQNKPLLLLVNSSYLFSLLTLNVCSLVHELRKTRCFAFMCFLVFVQGYEDQLCCINVLSE